MQISKSATKTKQIVPYFEEINKIKQSSTVSKEGLVSRLLNEKENEPTEDILKKIDMIIQEQWHLFVIFYQLQDTFPIEKKIIQEYKCKVEKVSSKDFEHFINSLFDSYGIKKNINKLLLNFYK